MTPAWINPRFRLIEGGATFSADDLVALAAGLEPGLRAAGGRAGVVVGVAAGAVAPLIAALIAAERADVALLPYRSGIESIYAAILVEAGGTLRVLAGERNTAPPPPAGFTVLLASSGTTGTPKLTRHALERLTGRLRRTDPEARWLLTYEPGAYAGLQVILTALASGATLIAQPGADAATLARAAARHGASHVSGTPSFWRAFLLAAPAPPPPLRVLTLGGEVADQATLDRLAAAFPGAGVRHLYASTEAGVLFSVADGRAGFPAAWLETGVDGVLLRVRNDVLDVWSPRRMIDYVGSRGGDGCVSGTISRGDGDGWLATGDRVEIRGDRVVFAGRADGMVNVGGVKVAPETVEAALLALPGVAEAAVRAVASPITGHLLTAAVVLAPGFEAEATKAAIREGLKALPPACRPRIIDVVPTIALSVSGKKRREGTTCVL